jgi:SPP1 gp7 family putative phage head morphogenesis protein
MIRLKDHAPNCSCCIDDSVPLIDALKFDPTGTTGIRRKFEADLVRRFQKVKSLIRQSLLINDAFGLQKNQLGDSQPAFVTDAQALPVKAFAFERPAEKIDRFMQWLKEAQNENILEVQGGQGIGKSKWANTYIDSAYIKGVRDAGAKMRKGGASVAESWVEQSFMRPIHADRLALAYTRAYNDLQGITDEMDKQISRILAQGLGEGKGPAEIARQLAERVDKIGITRAKVLARTEVVSAHAEASLNSYEEAGIEGVEVEAEWTTAGDDAVCPICESMEGKIYKISEARGMIPAHPGCRCSWRSIVVNGTGIELV